MEKAEHPAAFPIKVRLPERLQSGLQAAGLTPVALVLWTILAVAPLFVENEYLLRLMVVSLLFGAQAMAFDLTVGFINVVNFGFAAFVGLGGYTSGLLAARLGISPWVGLIAGPIVAGLLGFLTGVLTLRLRGIYAAIMAWFVGLALMGLAIVLVDLTRGQLGLIVPLFLDTADQRPYYYILWPIAFGIYVILRLVTNSHIGLAFRALGQNLDAARASGIDPVRYRVFNFTLACSLAGLLGVFYAHYVGILTPGVMLTKNTVEILAIAYIGGRGSIWGGMLAAFLVTPIFEYLRPLLAYRLIIYGVFLILTMIFYPGGLVAVIRKIGEFFRRRMESTHTIE
jgi:branched-chain amino acid transport system permease protein